MQPTMAARPAVLLREASLGEGMLQCLIWQIPMSPRRASTAGGTGPQYLRSTALRLGSRLARPRELLALLRTRRTKNEPVHDVGDGVRGFTRFAVRKAVVTNVRIDDELIALAHVRSQRGRRLAKGGKEEAGDDFLLVGATVVIAHEAQVKVRVVTL